MNLAKRRATSRDRIAYLYDVFELLGAASTDDGEDVWALLHNPGHGDRAESRPIPNLVSHLLERCAHTFLLSRLWGIVTDRRAALDLGFGLELALMRDHR